MHNMPIKIIHVLEVIVCIVNILETKINIECVYWSNGEVDIGCCSGLRRILPTQCFIGNSCQITATELHQSSFAMEFFT